MSSPNFLDVSYLFKRKLIEKLMSHFQLELSNLTNDSGYKALTPEGQMLALSELTHWWSLWFQKIPSPSRGAFELDEFIDVDVTGPSAVYCNRDGTQVFYDDFIPLSKEDKKREEEIEQANIIS